MREQKESKTVWVIAAVAIFVIYWLRCMGINHIVPVDGVFLHNRCLQMVDCLKHGYYPFLYYNDVGGIGYASPIFYGQLSLVPFIPFLGDVRTFLKVYFLCSLVLNFFAFRCCVKRYSEQATLMACFYIVSIPFICLFGTGLFANVMGLGFTWLFLAFCVDYFRDGRNLALVILTYFMIWQCNLNSAVVAVIACFCLFVMYFDKKRLKDYIKLFVSVACLLSFNVVNILIHKDAIRFVDTNYLFAGVIKQYYSVMSILPFGGFLLRSILHQVAETDLCCGICNFFVLMLFLYAFVSGFWSQSKRYKKCACALGVALLVGYVVGIWVLWEPLMKRYNIFFQFPLRYFILLFGALLILMSRLLKPSRAVYIVLSLCILDILISNPTAQPPLFREVSNGFMTIVNGEYAGSNYIDSDEVMDLYGSSVVSESGAEYSYSNEYNGVLVDCSANVDEDILTLPKLFYNGYRAYGSDGQEFFVQSGYSNFCEVDIGSYNGNLRLTYEVPWYILFLLFVQVGCGLYWSYVAASPLIKKRFAGK